MRRGSWTHEGLVTAFVAGETLNSLCKRVGVSPNTARKLLKEQLGEEQFRAIRDKNDPKQSTASEAELLAPFYTDEPFKKVATRLGVSPNTLRTKWVGAFGKVAFDARSQKLHSEAGTVAGLSRKGKVRVTDEHYRERDVARGSDHWCEVCGGGFVGYQALTHHMVRAGDEVHTKALEGVRRQVEDEKWDGLQEGQDFVVCAVCGFRGETLSNHIKLHGLTSTEYQAKYTALIRSDALRTKRSEVMAAAQFRDLFSKEDLLKHADENGRVIVSSVTVASGHVESTVISYCRRYNLPTRNKLAWQRTVLDKAASFLQSDYVWEWSDPRITTPTSGWRFNFDGFFPEHNLIIEAHGQQHYQYSELWHGCIEEFERQRELDVFKEAKALALGYKYRVIRFTDPVASSSFWVDLLGGSRLQWSNKTEDEKASVVASIFQIVRRHGWPELKPSVQIKAEFTRLQRLAVFLDDATLIRPYSTAGAYAAGTFFPNRYHAERQKGLSAWDMWHDDSSLRKAIRLQLDSGHPTTPERVLKAVVMFSRTPSVFRPAVAKYVYENYCPKGGVVWDPCAGYGGRLLGAMAAGVGLYIGTDLEPETAQGNQALAEALGFATMCRVECADATTFDPGEPLDLVFTSPPYFDLEVYGKKFEASVRGSSVEQWVQSFLGALVAQAAQSLKPGGFLVLNLPHKPVGGLRLDLAIQPLVERQGLVQREPVYMPVRSFKRGMKREPLLVWQKP